MFSWSFLISKDFYISLKLSYFKEICSLVFPKKLIYWKEILSFWRSFWAYFPKNSQRVFFLWYLIFKGLSLSSCFAPQSHLFWGWKCTFGYNCQSVKDTCGGELGWLGLTETWWPWNLTGNWALGNNLLSKGTAHSSWYIPAEGSPFTACVKMSACVFSRKSNGASPLYYKMVS